MKHLAKEVFTVVDSFWDESYHKIYNQYHDLWDWTPYELPYDIADDSIAIIFDQIASKVY